MSIFSGTNNPGIDLNYLTDLQVLILSEIAGLGTPGSDSILFFDVSAGSYQFLTPGSGITITGTTISATAASGATNAFVIAMATAL